MDIPLILRPGGVGGRGCFLPLLMYRFFLNSQHGKRLLGL